MKWEELGRRNGRGMEEEEDGEEAEEGDNDSESDDGGELDELVRQTVGLFGLDRGVCLRVWVCVRVWAGVGGCGCVCVCVCLGRKETMGVRATMMGVRLSWMSWYGRRSACLAWTKVWVCGCGCVLGAEGRKEACVFVCVCEGEGGGGGKQGSELGGEASPITNPLAKQPTDNSHLHAHA